MMGTWKRVPIMFCVAATLGWAGSYADAAIILDPVITLHDLQDPLGGMPPRTGGQVRLLPQVPAYLAPPGAGSAVMVTFAAEAATQFAGWIAATGAALSGTMKFNEYDARDYAAEPQAAHPPPRGGADMDARYTRAATDPATLQWINFFTQTIGGVAASHIDPFPNDDAKPFYYTDAEFARFGGRFGDDPDDPAPLPPPGVTTVSFQTYLASFDNAAKVATIHDGFSWGYRLNTFGVPEPGMGLLLLIVLVVLGLARRRESSTNKH